MLYHYKTQFILLCSTHIFLFWHMFCSWSMVAAIFYSGEELHTENERMLSPTERCFNDWRKIEKIWLRVHINAVWALWLFLNITDLTCKYSYTHLDFTWWEYWPLLSCDWKSSRQTISQYQAKQKSDLITKDLILWG